MVKKKRITTNHSRHWTTRPSVDQGSTTSELGMNPSKSRNHDLLGTSGPRCGANRVARCASMKEVMMILNDSVSDLVRARMIWKGLDMTYR